MKAAIPYFGTGTLALKGFLEDLGAEAVMPPPTSKRTLELGILHSPEQICLPFKITLGNLIEACEQGADTLFMAAGTRKCRFGYYHLVQERVIGRLFPGVRLFGLSQYSATEFVFRKLPEIFGVTPAHSLWAVKRLFASARAIHVRDNLVRRLRPYDFTAAEAVARERPVTVPFSDVSPHTARAKTGDSLVGTQLRRQCPRVRNSLSFRGEGAPCPVRIGLVGEVYLLLESFANSELEKELGRLGVEVVTERSLYNHLRHLLKLEPGYYASAWHARRYIGESPGGEVTKTIGETVRFARQGCAGAIHVFPFTCMPENMALEILQQVSEDYGLPVMSLSFDEHTSRTGLVTRLEAFVDMVTRRRAMRRCA
jgi:predicted nucleotide-binding protein (sugar kinase/HSP70/actin superfamily)